MRLATHSTTSPTSTAVGQSFIIETGGKRFSPTTTLVQWLGSFEFAKLIVCVSTKVKPIFDFVNTDLNNVSCLYENEDDEESI
jgi:hypothetical protein